MDKGLPCPSCGCRHHFTVRTRPATRGRIMRLRRCRNCERQMITYEIPAGSTDDVPHLDDLPPEQRARWVDRLLQLVGVRL